MRVVESAGKFSLPDLIAPLQEPLSAAFPAVCRVRTPPEYQRVFAGADFRVSDPGWTILVKGHSLQGARLGMAVSRKVSKRAVTRNRIKRLIRELFRTWPLRYELDLDVIIIARPALTKIESKQQRESLQRLLTRLANRFATPTQ